MPRRKGPDAPQSAQAAAPGVDRSRRKRNPSLKLREIAEESENAAFRTKRRKTAQEESPQYEEPPAESEPESEPEPEPVLVQSTPKRKRVKLSNEATATTPKGKAALVETPSRGTPRKKDALTPQRGPGSEAITPRRRNAADRSARKKSMRTLMRSVVANESEDEEDVDLAQAIYEDRSDDSEAAEEKEVDGDALEEPPEAAATTPSKRGPGRPRRKQESPTPPRDLPPHETYFLHNKPGRAKTSDNTLASLDLLTHDEYFSFYRAREDPHAPDLEFIESLHAASFPQWDFELSQGFTVCLYGLGSKKSLLTKFARHAHANRGSAEDRIVVVNGYVRTITTREILTAIYSALDPENPPPSAQPALILQAISSHLATKCPAATLTVLINSIDAPPLRKPATQTALAHLAAHPQVHLLCSADTPDFPLLWDISLRSTFNFVFHDATTVRPLIAELDVVDDVHELLGRAARRAGGREAVSAVLKSLTQAARGLYALLLAEVMAAMDDDQQGDGDENPGIEYRILYKKAVESFVGSSSEMAFRQVLREFLDHQMITSRKDALGTELISVPFRREEMEAILEDIET